VTPSGKQILIDGGPDLAALEHLGEHMSFFDRSIDLVVLTHPHADHMTALPDVLKRYDVGNLLVAMTESKNSRYKSFLEEASGQNIRVILPNPNEDIDIGDGIILDVIHPCSYCDMDTNNSSIVLRVLYKEHSILLTGDIEGEAEEKILKSGAELGSDLIKIAHHGSRTSSSTGFLLGVNPKQAFISVGEDNSYSHPSPEVIARLNDMNIGIKSTKDDGTIQLVLK
jgi:competence protein ComEC